MIAAAPLIRHEVVLGPPGAEGAQHRGATDTGRISVEHPAILAGICPWSPGTLPVKPRPVVMSGVAPRLWARLRSEDSAPHGRL